MLAVLVVAGTGAALAGFAPRASRRARGRRLPRRRAACRLRLRRRPLRRRRRRRDRPAAGRRGRRRDRRPAPAPRRCCWRRRAARRRSPCWPCIDLVSGANAHLTRSVLDAGGLDDLAEVAQRRLQLSAHSFAPADRLRLPAPARGGWPRSPYVWRATASPPGWPTSRRCAPASPAPWRRPCSARWPTTPAPSCSRSAPPICSSSPASPGPRPDDSPGRYP